MQPKNNEFQKNRFRAVFHYDDLNQKKGKKTKPPKSFFHPESRSVIFIDSFASKTNRLAQRFARYVARTRSYATLSFAPCSKKKDKMSRNNHK
jgi:hypothetical protein